MPQEPLIYNCTTDAIADKPVSCECRFAISEPQPLLITWILRGIRINPGGSGRISASGCDGSIDEDEECMSEFSIEPATSRDTGMLHHNH